MYRTPEYSLLARITFGLFATAGLVLVTALATLFSVGAPVLSVWLISLVFLMMTTLLIVVLPPPTFALQRNCFVLLAAFLFFTLVWPRYAFIRIPGLPGISPTRIALGLVVLGWLYLVVRSPVVRNTLLLRMRSFPFLFMLLAAYLAVRLASALASEVIFLSFRGLLNDLISVYLPLLAAITLIRGREDVITLLRVVLAGMLVVFAIGIYESQQQRNLFIAYFDIDSEYLENIFREKIRAGGYRIQSTFSHPLTLSEGVVIAFPAMLALFLTQRLNLMRVLLAVLLSAVAAFIIVKTGSRSGIGALVFTVGAAALMLALRGTLNAREPVTGYLHLLFAAFVVGAAVIAGYLLTDIIVGRTTREYFSGLARLQMWERGLDLAAERPIFGYGIDLAAKVLGFTGFGGTLTIDSYLLTVLLESGFVSLLVYILILLTAVGVGVRHGFQGFENSRTTLLLSVSVMSFLLIKTVLSLNHNHGFLMVLIGTMLCLVVMDIKPRRSARMESAPTIGFVP